MEEVRMNCDPRNRRDYIEVKIRNWLGVGVKGNYPTHPGGRAGITAGCYTVIQNSLSVTALRRPCDDTTYTQNERRTRRRLSGSESGLGERRPPTCDELTAAKIAEKRESW